MTDSAIITARDKTTGLTEFNRLLSEYILLPGSGDSGPTTHSLLGRASEFLSQRQKNEPPGIRDALFGPVVYVVLNFPHQRDARNRWFIGIMKCDNLSPMTHDLLSIPRDSAATQPRSENSADKCDLLFTDCHSRSAEQTLVNNARCIWGAIWERYQIETRNGMRQNRFTWNQYLAHNAKRPRVIGLTWGNGHNKELDDLYWSLTPKLAKSLGICLDGKQTTLDAMAEHCSFASRETTDLRRLADRLGEMSPSSPKAVLTENVAFSVYHLIRSFAFWGGSSFLSIPIRHSLDGVDKTAILSICTKRELFENEISRWELIATKILSPLLSVEESDLRRRAERTTAVEAGEHTAKNAVKATGWRRALKAVSQEMRNGNDLRNETRVALEYARRALMNFMMVEGQHGVRRLFALCAQEEFTKIENWTSKTAMKKWSQGGDSLRSKWDKYLENIILNLLDGLGWNRPVQFQDSHGVEWTALGKSPPDMVPAELWEQDGALPPFVLAEGSDSHFALVACLIEPLANAARNDRTMEMRIEVSWDHPNGISICVKNRLRPGLKVDEKPPGLALLQLQLRESHLAHVLEPRLSDDGNTFSVSVMLHPHQLADLILANQ